MCEGCKTFVLHTYFESVPVGIHMIDIVYECARCGTHRVYGREETRKGHISDRANA